jgi:hypothetical protein
MSLAVSDDGCPIPERMLFQIYDASKRGHPIPQFDLPAETKSMLALFCYRRSHLESAGLAIAATCEEPDLLSAGGALGAVLFARSRKYHPPPAPSGLSLRIAISPPIADSASEDESEATD